MLPDSSENQLNKKSRKPEDERVLEEVYATGIPAQDVHVALETLFNLRLSIPNDEGRNFALVAKRQKYPGHFYLMDSQVAQKDLQALIPLVDYLKQISPKPQDMCDLDIFEQTMGFNNDEIRPFIKKAILKGLTYTDKEGKQKPLAQFYVDKTRIGKDAYGICVPNDLLGQKALLELAGFHILESNQIYCRELDGGQWLLRESIIKGATLNDLANELNETRERMRQVLSKELRFVRYVFDHPSWCDIHHQPTDKDVLYIRDLSKTELDNIRQKEGVQEEEGYVNDWYNHNTGIEGCLITKKKLKSVANSFMFVKHRSGKLRLKSKDDIIRFEHARLTRGRE